MGHRQTTHFIQIIRHSHDKATHLIPSLRHKEGSIFGQLSELQEVFFHTDNYSMKVGEFFKFPPFSQ